MLKTLSVLTKFPIIKKVGIVLIVLVAFYFYSSAVFDNGVEKGKSLKETEQAIAYTTALQKIQKENQKRISDALELQQQNHNAELERLRNEANIGKDTETVKTKIVEKFKYKKVPMDCTNVIDDTLWMLEQATGIIGTGPTNSN